MLRHVLLLASLAVFSSVSAHSAVITGSFTNNATGSYNLTTTYGTLDWIYYDRNTNTNVGTSAAPDNSKSGAALIGNAYVVGGTPSDSPALRYSNSGTTPIFDFPFTDGTSPTSGTAFDAMGVFNTDLNEFGAGVGVDITLPGTGTYLVTVFVSGFGVNGRFTATLPNALTYNDISYVSDASSRVGAYYQLEVTPDQIGDVLSINFVQNSSTSGSSHVMLAAVAIAPIPESSAALLFGLGAFPLLLARRRRRPAIS